MEKETDDLPGIRGLDRGGERGGALLALGRPNSQETEVLAEVRVLEQGGRSIGFQRHQHGCPADALRGGA